MIRFVKPPFDPPRPNDLAGQLAEAIRIAAADLASKKETELGHVVTGCDGYPVVTIGDGTSCHDNAKAANGGGLALTANLGGSRAVINANLGRSQSMNSGYQGTGLSSGAIPPAMDAGAADVSLNPIDTSTNLAINAGDSADPLAALIGATISGKTGAGRFTAYALTGGSASPPAPTYKLWYWADCTTADPPSQVTTTAPDSWSGYQFRGLVQVETISPTRAVALEAGAATLYFYEDGAEVGTYTIAGFDLIHTLHHSVRASRMVIVPGTGGDEAIVFGFAELSRDNWSANYGLIHVTGLLTGTCVEAHTWIQSDWSDYLEFPTGLTCGADGSLFLSGEVRIVTHGGAPMYYENNYDTGKRRIIKWASPYMADPVTWYEVDGGSGNALQWSVIRAKPDTINDYILGRRQFYNGSPWYWSREPGQYVPMISGITYDVLDANCFFDNVGNVWFWVEDNSSNQFLFRFCASNLSYGVTASIALSPSGAGLSYAFSGDVASADNSILFFMGSDTATPTGFSYMRAPYETGATITEVASPDATDPVFWVTVPHAEFYDVDAILTIAVSVSSTTGSGDSITVVTRADYANTGADEAWGVLIEMDLPEGSTFVSATDDGEYDAGAGVIRWLIPSVAASATGFVELTTSVG